MRVLTLMMGAALALAACSSSERLPGSAPTVAVPSVAPVPAADRFDFPLDPTRFGPYVLGVSGPLDVDTRFGVTNPGLGRDGKCFVDRYGDRVPFDTLYHAGEDWFGLDVFGQVVPGLAAGAPVQAVGHGVVSWTQPTAEGGIVVIEHLLADGAHVWSAYWHLDQMTVARGQAVRRGDTIGRVLDRGGNSHLHWEIRTWGDGSQLFPFDSAGGRGTCNGRVPALGYTWDDIPARAAPQAWGYLNPVQFIRDHH